MTPETFRGEETLARMVDPRSVAPFNNKSVSDVTSRTYGQMVRDFFRSVGMKHSAEMLPNDILLCEDSLHLPTQQYLNFDEHFTGTVRDWGRDIFAYFQDRYDNGFTEWMNHDVKDLQSDCRRLHFDAMHLKIVYRTLSGSGGRGGSATR